MGIFSFIKSKSFLLNLGIAIMAFVLILWGAMSLLASYTHHGETVTVPNFGGLKTTELKKFADERELRYMVVDSVYDAKRKKGVVIDQDPISGSFVKRNRTIYLTMNAMMPPMVKMPNLVDLTLRQATAKLETYGFKLGNLEYIPDLAKNAVLAQKVKGNKVEPGALVEKGITVNLVLGDGLSDNKVSVPNLTGLSKSEAIAAITASSLSLGAIVFDADVKDSIQTKVYKQKPAYSSNAMIKIGESVDLFLTQDLNKVKGEPNP